jgi:hypothetical protein
MVALDLEEMHLTCLIPKGEEMAGKRHQQNLAEAQGESV